MFKEFFKTKQSWKAYVRNRTSYRIRRGYYGRPPRCSVCGCTGGIEGHHEDYAKPDEVILLCNKHHKEADQRKRHR